MMIMTWRTRRRSWSRRRRSRTRSITRPPSKRRSVVEDGAARVEQREPHDDHDLEDPPSPVVAAASVTHQIDYEATLEAP